MGKLLIHNIDEFMSLAGKDLGSSDWLKIDQTMIDNFAMATLDHQWIHVDGDRVAKESPYGSSIAHGYLTLSLIPYFLDQIIEIPNLHMVLNYGIDKMVYNAPVLEGTKLRLNAYLKSVKDLGNMCLTNIQCSFETERCDSPVLEGNIKFLYYFK